MSTSAQEIIQHLEGNYPVSSQITLHNHSDLDLDQKTGTICQLLIGVTQTDPYGTSINFYKSEMKNRFAGLANVETFGWPYNASEIDQLTKVLSELGEHFKVDLNIPRMFRKSNVNPKSDETYYLVITVLIYRIIVVGKDEG